MYRLRFLGVMIRSLFSRKRALSEAFVLHFWAIPLLDTDFTLLFTQTYGQYMGLARWNLLFNSEFRNFALKKGWVPVTTRETIAYKRPVKAFDRVKLTTTVIYWNERRFYMEQRFEVQGKTKALAYVEGLVRSPKGHLKPAEAFAAMGLQRASPLIPEHLRAWMELRYD